MQRGLVGDMTLALAFTRPSGRSGTSGFAKTRCFATSERGDGGAPRKWRAWKKEGLGVLLLRKCLLLDWDLVGVGLSRRVAIGRGGRSVHVEGKGSVENRGGGNGKG